MTSHATSAGGARLAFRVDGAGPPLLLIGPLPGTIELWGRFRELLAARAQVVSFDQRGMGGSSPARLGVTTRDLARDALAVLDAAGIERADVFGVSLGGMAATWLAAEAPARVGALVLASTLVRGPAAARSLGGLVRSGASAPCLLRGARAFGRCLARTVLSPEFRAAHPGEAARIEEVLAAGPRSRRSVAALAAAAAFHDARAALPRIEAPALVLCGEHDRVITCLAQQPRFAALRDVRFATIAGAGHTLSLEAPAATAAHVLAFVSAA